MSEKVLCLAAHCDDESFGCLGTLLKHKEAGDSINFGWWASARGTTIGAFACLEYFKAGWVDFCQKDQELDKVDFLQLIRNVEYLLKRYKPTIVYMPFIGDLNRDHRVIAEAAMVACRPYKEHAPKEVWMYEIPGSTELGLQPFYPDRVENIDKEFKEKLIRQFYPDELTNGREVIKDVERFERWPRI